jgi:broad specificity phosphatase PhoE
VLQSAGLENLQEELQIPNHRVPLSAQGVQQSFAAGQLVHQLLYDAHDHHEQQQQQHNGGSASSSSSSSSRSSKVFMYTSPFLRCIQTAQHVVRALKDEQVNDMLSNNCCAVCCSQHNVQPLCVL